jgi:N-acetylglutamate synthase-like GNAT family acetyltransferase
MTWRGGFYTLGKEAAPATRKTMEIRVAESKDARDLVRVINGAFQKAEGFVIDRDRIDLETVRSLMEKGTFLLAEEEGGLAGCVYLEPPGKRMYLGLLSVDPARQKAGLGSMLLQAAEQKCSQDGSDFIDLKTINLRTDNRAFYSRRGYVETGTEPFPSDLNPKLPCHFVLMSKSLR